MYSKFFITWNSDIKLSSFWNILWLSTSYSDVEQLTEQKILIEDQIIVIVPLGL